eukprot:gene9652-656_t
MVPGPEMVTAEPPCTPMKSACVPALRGFGVGATSVAPAPIESRRPVAPAIVSGADRRRLPAGMNGGPRGPGDMTHNALHKGPAAAPQAAPYRPAVNSTTPPPVQFPIAAWIARVSIDTPSPRAPYARTSKTAPGGG